MIVTMIRVLVASFVLMAACADAPPPRSEGSPSTVPRGVPDVAKITCEADGSTLVSTREVVMQADGIHVEVVSHLDEPASIGLFGRDVEPGRTRFASVRPPGEINGACYPFSEHDGGAEPPSEPIDVLDPHELYVSGEIQCDGMSWGGVSDFAEVPLDTGPVPLEAARAAIEGLRSDDELLYVGYPMDPRRSVGVLRDGSIVATFSFVTFDGAEWSIEGSEGCSSSGLEWG